MIEGCVCRTRGWVRHPRPVDPMRIEGFAMFNLFSSGAREDAQLRWDRSRINLEIFAITLPPASLRKKRMNLRLIVLTGSLVLCVGAANAAFIEYNTVLAPSSTPFSTTFSVPLFNSSLGTLNNVSLSLVSHIIGRIDVFNNLGTPQTFTNAFVSIPVTVTANTPDATSVTAVAIAALASGTAAPGFPISSFTGIVGTASNSVNVLPLNFAPYIGMGGTSASFTANRTDGTFGGTSVPGLFFGGSAVADGLFTVRYSYDAVSAVPVPASALLLGSGLLSLGAAWRRKRI